MPPTGTRSQLLQCFLFHHLIFVLFIQHSSSLYIFISHSISQPSSNCLPSSLVHSALLVCCNGPWGWSWLLPTKYKTSMTDSRAKRLAQTERGRKCCFLSVYVRQSGSAVQLTIKQLKDDKVRLSRD